MATIIDGMAFAHGRWKYHDESEQLTLDAVWDQVNHDSDYVLNFCEACQTEGQFHVTYTDYFITHRDVGVDAVPMWECSTCGKTYGASEIFDAVDQIVERLNLHNTTVNYVELRQVVINHDSED
jgi:YgiT-type zinc finger domain-containing protein